MIDDLPALVASPASPDAGAFSSIVELRAVQARLGERRRRDADDTALWDAVESFVRRGRATGVILDDDDERWRVQGLLDYWAAALERTGRLRPDSSLVEFDPEQAPELPDAACPYLGLNAFEEKDSRVFFGRDALLDKLVQQVAEHRLVALVGPSGCGKSSLVFAGLVSSLRKGAVPGSEAWRIRWMTPGAEPRAALASLLEAPARDTGPSDAMPVVGVPVVGVPVVGVPVVGAPVVGVPVVVVIDQFEELFTLCRSEAEQAGFVADLLALVTASSPLGRVVLTMRSDFESFVTRHPALYEAYVAGRVAVTPPSAVELRQAIGRPAALVDLRFEAGVIDRLLQELLGEPAGLPLLQFTLFRLWQERRRNRVTAACFERVGGGRQALARAADALYDAMIPEDQMTARRILLLVGLAVDDKHEQTRTRVPRSQFLDTSEDPGRVERVLDRLIEARLLRQTAGGRDAAPQVEVAHEALVRNWPRLAEWLQEAQTGVVKKRRLEARVNEWIERGRGTASLLDRVELSEAMQWMTSDAARRVGYGAELPALLEASRRELEEVEHRGRQRRRRAFAALLGFALVALVLASGAWSLRQEAQRQTEATHRLLETNYLEQGRALLFDGHPMQALAYLVAARNGATDSPVLRMLFAQASANLPLVTFVGHASHVTRAAFSPDGTRVVTASDDRTVRIWNAATGQPITPPLRHQDVVTAVAFSPDGTRVVTASQDENARVWSVATGALVTGPLAHADAVLAAAWSPDGKRVVTASADQTARIWDASSGRQIKAIAHRGSVYTAAFSPDGTRVVTASADRTARVWDATTDARVTPPLDHAGEVNAAAWSPDGTRVVTASDDHTARVWDAATGKPLTGPLDHAGEVNAAAWSPDGTRVVTASDDRTARVWDAVTGKQLTPRLEHQSAVRAAVFSPDGTRVVTASDDKTVRVWDASTGKPVTPSLEHLGSVHSAVFSPDGMRVVTAADDNTARVWDALPARVSTQPLEHRQRVYTATFSPDGKRVVTASQDNTARVWDAATGQPVSPPLAHRGPVYAAAFSPDGTRVVTASDDRTARVWNASTGAPVTPPLEHQDIVNVAAFSADGRRVVTASQDTTARVWDAATGKPLTRPLEHRGAVNTAAFSPDGTHVVTASSDKTAQVWDAATGDRATLPLEHRDEVNAAVFSPDGTRVVTASDDMTARVWDAAIGAPLTAALEHHGKVNAAMFSPDGSHVVTASQDKTAQIWDASTGAPATPPLEHQAAVQAAAWSPDGTRVITASDDKTARVWDATTGRPVIPPFEHDDSVTAAAFSSNTTYVVTASQDKTARVWWLPANNGPIESWLIIAQCSVFTLADGVLTSNLRPLPICPLRNRRTPVPGQ